MSLYTGLATSAKAVDELSAATDPLDEKDPAFADTRKRLEKVELYQTVSENGKEVSKAVEGKERDKMIAQIVAAAKLEADSELRGASSPESPAAKKFMNAADAEAKKAVYRETLNEKIDLALLQSFLVAETTKINREMDKKYSGDRKKADEEAKILLSARTKEIKEKIANIGKSGAENCRSASKAPSAIAPKCRLRRKSGWPNIKTMSKNRRSNQSGFCQAERSGQNVAQSVAEGESRRQQGF